MKNTICKNLMNKEKYRSARPKQDGVVLFIALIVLVAMSLAGVSMMRSVDAGNKIAGNLAFRQAAIHSAEAAFEQAIAQVRTMARSGDAGADNAGFGYSITYQSDRYDAKNWENAWKLGTDSATGNDVAIFIDMMCAGVLGCQQMMLRSSTAEGVSQSAPLTVIPVREHYRVLAQVTSPQGLITYIEEKLY